MLNAELRQLIQVHQVQLPLGLSLSFQYSLELLFLGDEPGKRVDIVSVRGLVSRTESRVIRRENGSRTVSRVPISSIGRSVDAA